MEIRPTTDADLPALDEVFRAAIGELFRRPDRQGRGLGRALLERACGDEGPRRLTITDSIQPISNGLYARYGLLPATPMLALLGTPRVEEREALEPAAPAPEALASLDAASYGFDRAVDHAYWRGVGRGTLWLRDGEPAAYSYVVDGAWIGPVAGVDPRTAADALRAELARAEGRVRVLVPGSSRA